MRLTKKELMSVINQPMCFGSRLVGKKMFAQIIKELCEYKTIEEELGIDLMTLFKALKGLIYKPTYKEMIKYCGGRYPRYAEGFCLRYNEPTNRYFLEVGSPISDVWQVLELKDYGKNWALTKKELEK